jgi:cytochrome P450
VAEPRLAHALPQNFPDPGRFDPDRFLAGGSPARGYGFIAFGGGVHACLGAQLAITIAKVFASRMLGRWRWSRRGEPRFQSFPLRKISADYRIGLTTLTPTATGSPPTEPAAA